MLGKGSPTEPRSQHFVWKQGLAVLSRLTLDLQPPASGSPVSVATCLDPEHSQKELAFLVPVGDIPLESWLVPVLLHVNKDICKSIWINRG